MSLRIKLASLFIFVALSILVIGLVNIQLMRGTTQEYTKLTDQNVPVFEALGHIHSSVTKIREETLTVLLLISEAQQSQTTPHQLDQEILEEYEEVEEAYQDFTLWLDHYSALVTDPRRQALVQEIAQVGRDGFEASQMIITLKEQEGSGDTIFGHRDNLEQAEKDIDALLNTAIDLERAAFNANRSQANSNANLTYTINTISILASLGLAIFTGWIISRTVADPITKLKEAAAAIGRGQLDTTVSIHSSDEFEFLGQAFNQMALDLSQTTVSKAYLDNIINSMGEMLIVIDPDHTISRVNQTTLDLLQYEERELIGQPARLVLAEKMVAELFTQETVRNVETTYLTQGDQDVPVLFSSSLLHDPEGQIQGVVCIAFDISERKKTEDALRQREAQLSEAQRIAKLGYWRRDLANNQIHWSEQTYEIYEVSPQVEPTLDIIYSKTLPEDVDLIQNSVQSAIENGATMYSFEHRVFRRDGIGYINSIGHIIREPDGQPLLTYGTSQDITQLKQVEVALQRSSEQLTTMYEIAQLISSTLDFEKLLDSIAESTACLFNCEACTIRLLDKNGQQLNIVGAYGIDQQVMTPTQPKVGGSIVGKTVLLSTPTLAPDLQNNPDFNHPAAIKEGLLSCATVPLKVGLTAIGALDVHSKTKKNAFDQVDLHFLEKLASQAAIAIENARLYAIAQHEIIEHERIARDLEQARDQALEASRLKSELLAKVSHELRTPLGAILGYTELLKNGIFGPVSDQHSRIYHAILDNTHYLNDMVNELLDQAQLESGKIKLNIEAFSSSDLIDPIMARMDILAKAKNLKLKFEVDPALPANLWSDKKRLQQVIANLISNAIKFTPTGQVEVRLYAVGPDHWAIRVSDTGQGIPKEAQNYIFEPFRQVDGSATRQHTGAGLGLSIVKQMVALLDGKIELTSELNQGSTFVITLPVITPERKRS